MFDIKKKQNTRHKAYFLLWKVSNRLNIINYKTSSSALKTLLKLYNKHGSLGSEKENKIESPALHNLFVDY